MQRTPATVLSASAALFTLSGLAAAQEFIPQPALGEFPLPACEGAYAAYRFYFDRGDCRPLSFVDDHCATTPDEAFQRNEYFGSNYTGLVEWTPVSITIELDIFASCTEHTGEAFLYSTFTVDQVADLHVDYKASSPAGDAFVSIRDLDLGARVDPFISEPRFRVYRLVPGVVYRADMVCGSYPYEPMAASSSGHATINAILMSTSCPADCDGDGELTFFDFLCFQNQFSAGCP
jgi:hypothetical protein